MRNLHDHSHKSQITAERRFPERRLTEVATRPVDGGYNVTNAPGKFTVCSPVWRINTRSGAEDAAFNAELYDGTSKSPLVMSAGPSGADSTFCDTALNPSP